MTPLQDASTKPPKYPAELEASMILPKQRASPASSLASLPYRRSNPSLQKLFQSTASISGSRASSGTATPTASVVPGSVFSPGARQNGTGTPNSLPPGVSDEYRSLIQRAFVPHVAVVADTETEDLIRGKGLEGGLLQLLRPFGEHVPGKVTIRDSVGAGRSWEDFGVRFVGANDGLGIPPAPAKSSGLRISTDSQRGGGRVSSSSIRPRRVGGDVAQIEDLVGRHLQYSEFNAHDPMPDYFDQMEAPAQADATSSPFYALFLKRLLSGIPLVPHETFAHPVASVIAVSSSNADAIEELRRLYARQTQGDLRMPQWVDNQYLRYYVLVHDEEKDDIAKSNAIFDQMKRHFGLHCHLLRLKRQQCIPSDDDAVRLPTCEWMSASEELAEIQRRETADDITDPAPYLPDSDITGIRTFIRELVAQSIIPHMERQTAQWNEQVLARRRGVAGRFMSISKRWTPFGGSRSSSSSSTSSNSNYDSLQGFYRPDAPEALMRKLADYSFMLRDYKLALSTYDILRSDFTNDKAWLHAAGALEMASLSALMTSGPLPTKARTENVDQWIEQAWYSYTNRQGTPTPYYGLRTLATSVELLRLRGSSAADDAARWAARILDTGLVGPVGNALFTERVSACYAVRMGIGSMNWGSRRRKAALWSVLAASTWFQLSKSLQAEKCLDAALRLYSSHQISNLQEHDAARSLPFPQMQTFIDELRQQIINLRLEHRGGYSSEDDGEGTEVEQSIVEEATETLDASPRLHRKSLIGAAAPPVDMGPLSPTLERTEQEPDDLFEGA
ncbi:ER-golgi trafficking TRAPP I complex 85 kDa subunit-domain-containing protein [Lophiotrema nucula]|uniref:ER-golgi trafficking TRAPP I complex 85 kDa subunit-domain-containing protein n=1 Tax=Lophiotrema nucula TaxID=690887 RepID=A0A6A5ZRM0_9PLEO|nr:ER-golgi trafficking TRAPP I complex 85 kDa subunit-domain-containing protein [Lophiotrema nucula]